MRSRVERYWIHVTVGITPRWVWSRVPDKESAFSEVKTRARPIHASIVGEEKQGKSEAMETKKERETIRLLQTVVRA
jgi:hypothetical protein